MKGEKPPVPTRGVSKRSAGGADVDDEADDIDDDGATDDAANAAADLIPRTDIRFTVSIVYNNNIVICFLRNYKHCKRTNKQSYQTTDLMTIRPGGGNDYEILFVVVASTLSIEQLFSSFCVF